MKTTKFSRIISLVLVFVMLSGMLVFDTGAKVVYDEKNESLFTYVIEGEGDSATVTILKCSDKATGKVVIPAKIDGVPVTKIDKGAFEGCSSITSLVIPEGVEVIGGETPEVTITKEDYLDLFVKRGLIYHLNFVGVEADTKIPGASAKYNDETALATERFGSVPKSYWNQYIYDNVKGENDGDLAYVSAGIPTVEGGWKFKTPYTYDFWFTQNNTAGDKKDFANFVTDDNKADFTLAGTSSQVTIGEETKPVYDVIHTAPKEAKGFYITEGVDGKAVYSSYMGDGYMRLNHAGSVGYMQANVDQLSGDYTVELALKQPASVRPDAYYMQCGTLVETLVDTESNYIYLKSGADYYYMTGLVTKGIIKYTVTADRDAEGSGATVGFFVNGRNDFVKSNTDSTPVSSTKQFSSLSKNFWVQMQAPGVETYAIRVYDTVLTEAEVLQNNFADIATVAQLDISEFLKLTETEKQDVYTAFKGVDATASTDAEKQALQEKLDACFPEEEEEEVVYSSYYDLFVKDGLVYHMNFASIPDEQIGNKISYTKYGPYIVGGNELATQPWFSGGNEVLQDGYLDTDNIYIYSGIKSDTGININGKQDISVELVASGTQGGRFVGTLGAYHEFYTYENGVFFQKPPENPNQGMADTTAIPSWPRVEMSWVDSEKTVPFNGLKINTYAFTYSFNNPEDAYAYAFNAYGNGRSYFSQALKSTTTGFQGGGQICRIGGNLSLYAVRVYEKTLTADEVLQNHFADVALIKRLDITKFEELSEDGKKDVYRSFANVIASEDKSVLQKKLDEAVLLAQYYSLFVEDDLVYHVNFAEAKSGSSVTANSSYDPYYIYVRDGIGKPVSSGVGNAFGDGYVNMASTSIGTYLYNAEVKEALKAATEAVSIETVIEGIPATEGGRAQAYFYIGPMYKINLSATNPYFGVTSTSDMVISGSTYPTTEWNNWYTKTDGTKINTYTNIYDLANIASNKYDYIQYANGANKGGRTGITTSSGTTYFKAPSGLIQPSDGSMNLYAFRVYDRKLSLNKALQNHFADVALVNRLDISEFLQLTDEAEKLAVYTAFKDVPLNGENLQAKLDAALPQEEVVTYDNYDLFVSDGLVYHMNFASIPDEQIGNKISYTKYGPYIVGGNELVTQPWFSGNQEVLQDGYLDVQNIYIYSGIKSDTGININGKKDISVELVASGTQGARFIGTLGAYHEFYTYENGVFFQKPPENPNQGMADTTAIPSWPRVEMKWVDSEKTVPFNGLKINTYAFTYSFNNPGDAYAYAFNAYGNGRSYFSQALKSTTTGFQGSGQIYGLGGNLSLYAVRVYEKTLTADEVLQNHFADIVTIKGLELDVEKFITVLSNEERTVAYKAFESKSASEDAKALQETLEATLVGTACELKKGMFADCESLTSITVLAESAPQIPADAFSGSSVEEIVVPASAVSAYKEAEGWSELAGGIISVTADDILTFKGYQVRLNKSPGIRSMYSIDRAAIELLEAENKTVIVGSIMAAATNERTTRADLKLPVDGNGKYDPTGKIANAAYKEIYHTGEGTDGVIGLLTNVTDAAYEFAYTTTYTEAQTKAHVNRGALYVGFVVVIDNATGDETIFYTNEVSPTFDGDDDNGEAISLYDLYNHFNADPQYEDNEIFKMVFDAKEAQGATVEE